MYLTPTVNHFKVPVKQWRKWSEAARAVFNRVHDFVVENPTLMSHPKAGSLKPAHWKTIAWNAAWVAAAAVDEEVITQIDDIDTKRRKVVARHTVRSALQ